jgi:hypothetical protein
VSALRGEPLTDAAWPGMGGTPGKGLGEIVACRAAWRVVFFDGEDATRGHLVMTFFRLSPLQPYARA